MPAVRGIPAAFYRGGSSKGLFFRAEDLPADPGQRDAVLLRALGSPDRYQRQLDGMGGGLSSVSKAVIVEAGVDGFDLSVVTCDEACQGDIDGDGFVSVPDMLAMFAEWGPCPVGGCDSDLDGDGNVNVADLLILFAAWGTCP